MKCWGPLKVGAVSIRGPEVEGPPVLPCPCPPSFLGLTREIHAGKLSPPSAEARSPSRGVEGPWGLPLRPERRPPSPRCSRSSLRCLWAPPPPSPGSTPGTQLRAPPEELL